MKPKVTYKKAEGRAGYDNCQTPPYAIDFLLSMIGDNLPPIWDPAGGDGLIVKRLHQLGHDAQMTDIYEGYDFFSFTPGSINRMIITNPPFSRKYEFLQHCIEFGKPFAIIMPVEALGTASMARLIIPRMHFLIPERRIGFKMPVKGWRCSPQFPTMWVVYDPELADANLVRYGKINVWKPDRLEQWEADYAEGVEADSATCLLPC